MHLFSGSGSGKGNGKPATFAEQIDRMHELYWLALLVATYHRELGNSATVNEMEELAASVATALDDADELARRGGTPGLLG